MKKLLFISLIAAILSTSFGCQLLQNRRYDSELKLFLPNTVGYTWNYWGFAEYDHQMRLDSIQKRGISTLYRITGEVGDPSGGEAQRDRSLSITYTVGGGAWVQEKTEQAMMDSEFDRLEILRGPIVEGTTWTQRQADKQGRMRTLDCKIEEIRHETQRVLTVSYRDRDSDYYEKRTITQGIGITMVEKLWMSPDGNFEIGYQLYEGF